MNSLEVSLHKGGIEHQASTTCGKSSGEESLG